MEVYIKQSTPPEYIAELRLTLLEKIATVPFGALFKGVFDKNPNEQFAVKQITVQEEKLAYYYREVIISAYACDTIRDNALHITCPEDYTVKADWLGTVFTGYLAYPLYNFGMLSNANIALYISKQSIAEQATFMLQLVKTLQLLHKNGIAHGNITLDNVLVRQEQRRKLVPYLSDFGLACIADWKRTSLETWLTTTNTYPSVPRDVLRCLPDNVVDLSWTQRDNRIDRTLLPPTSFFYIVVADDVYSLSIVYTHILTLNSIVRELFERDKLDETVGLYISFSPSSFQLDVWGDVYRQVLDQQLGTLEFVDFLLQWLTVREGDTVYTVTLDAVQEFLQKLQKT